MNAFRLQPPALFLAGLGHFCLAILAHCLDFLPDALDLGIIYGGSLLVGGALSIAWGERNLLSEQSFQYSTMAALFGDAEAELKRKLELLEQKIENGQDLSETLQEIKEFALALGREALAENGEWLILHRARPFEPVFA